MGRSLPQELEASEAAPLTMNCSDKDSQSLSDITDCNFALKHPWSTFAL